MKNIFTIGLINFLWLSGSAQINKPHPTTQTNKQTQKHVSSQVLKVPILKTKQERLTFNNFKSYESTILNEDSTIEYRLWVRLSDRRHDCIGMSDQTDAMYGEYYLNVTNLSNVAKIVTLNSALELNCARNMDPMEFNVKPGETQTISSFDECSHNYPENKWDAWCIVTEADRPATGKPIPKDFWFVYFNKTEKGGNGAWKTTEGYWNRKNHQILFTVPEGYKIFGQYQEGFCAIRKMSPPWNMDLGYCNDKGEIVIPPQFCHQCSLGYSESTNFENGEALVATDDTKSGRVGETCTFYIINKKGEKIKSASLEEVKELVKQKRKK
jgi:hypothetical protein